jgi:hypothetical protein
MFLVPSMFEPCGLTQVCGDRGTGGGGWEYGVDSAREDGAYVWGGRGSVAVGWLQSLKGAGNQGPNFGTCRRHCMWRQSRAVQ